MSAVELEWVFAYGSNMNLDDLRAWFARKGYAEPRIERIEAAALNDYRLVWNYYSTTRGAGAANVERTEGGCLPGVALFVCRNTRDAIDEKEGHPNYYSRGERPVCVELANGTSVDAWLYVALPSRCRIAPQWPSRAYLDLLVRAAEQHALPDEHIALLKATPTIDGSHV